MFSLQIVDTDAFLDMSISAQALYFHLSMRADDDGFVDNPKKIMKMIGAQDDDLKILLAKRFILGFEKGIIVIKHWRLNNYIRKDRYQETVYLDEKKQLRIKKNGSYTETGQPNDNQMTTSGRPSIDKIRLDKIRLDKNSILRDKSREGIVIPDLLKDKQKHIQIIGLWAKAKNIVFTSKEHQQSFIKRNLRAATNLKPYSLQRIVETMAYLIQNADFKTTLESVGKYIDEDLTKLNNNKIHDLRNL